MSLPQPLVICLIAINGIGFFLYGLDKAFSKQKGHPRIPERVLLWLARLGGGVGCWLGMLLFRHKTKHIRFKVLVPLWTVAWGILLLLLYYHNYVRDSQGNIVIENKNWVVTSFDNNNPKAKKHLISP